jgi:hypothetical protein
MIFGYFTLFVALILSAVAAYYSIVGLTAIFSAAIIPIVIMGASLEIGKVTAAVWLKLNWHRASLTYKLYLVPALVFLMLLTSMGIFGFLSKAHSDQSLVSGDVTSKIAIYDEKIKTEKENIEANRKALKQMDEGVDQVLGRSADEKGADKAVALRRSQQKERARLQAEISQSQKSIAELGDARAPIAAEVRKVEAEVGPIKYIAAFIYGDNPDANLLEKAVTWVIIIIVAVFDPLALVLILAAQQSLKWERQAREDRAAMGIVPPDVVTRPFTPEEIAALDQTEPDPKYDPDDGPLTTDQVQQIKKTTAEQHPYLAQPFVHFKNLKPIVHKVEDEYVKWPGGVGEQPVLDSEDDLSDEDDHPKVKEAIKIWKMANPNETIKEQRHRLARGIISELPWMKLIEDTVPQGVNQGFGAAFPVTANKGDTFIRVDRLPNQVYKFNGIDWIQIDKQLSDSYTYDEAYIDYLIEKISVGEYDAELLSDSERDQVAVRLQQTKQ